MGEETQNHSKSTSSLDIPNDDSILAMRDAVIGQVDFARRYTLSLLENVPDSLWPVIPPGATSHIAWQVGHLAVSQYGLMLFRQRGRAEGDLDLMPGWLRKRFGRGSMPPTEPSEIPSKSELLASLEKIHIAANINPKILVRPNASVGTQSRAFGAANRFALNGSTRATGKIAMPQA